MLQLQGGQTYNQSSQEVHNFSYMLAWNLKGNTKFVRWNACFIDTTVDTGRVLNDYTGNAGYSLDE